MPSASLPLLRQLLRKHVERRQRVERVQWQPQAARFGYPLAEFISAEFFAAAYTATIDIYDLLGYTDSEPDLKAISHYMSQGFPPRDMSPGFPPRDEAAFFVAWPKPVRPDLAQLFVEWWTIDGRIFEQTLSLASFSMQVSLDLPNASWEQFEEPPPRAADFFGVVIEFIENSVDLSAFLRHCRQEDEFLFHTLVPLARPFLLQRWMALECRAFAHRESLTVQATEQPVADVISELFGLEDFPTGSAILFPAGV